MAFLKKLLVFIITHFYLVGIKNTKTDLIEVLCFIAFVFLIVEVLRFC